MSAAFAIAVFVIAYGLIATERIGRVPAALGGAGLVMAAGLVDSHDTFFSEKTGVDWNVIFLLLGMMIIVGVIRRTGLFEYLAIKAMKVVGGRPLPLMVLLALITAVASALLDNVTTILLIAPVTFSVCRRLGLPTTPYLLAEVFASNIGGAATLIGDPPNIIIASRSGLTFNDFLFNMAPIVIIAMLAFLIMLRPMCGRMLPTDAADLDAALAVNENDSIKDPKLLVQSSVVLCLVLIGFVLHSVVHTEASVVALLGAGVLIAISGSRLGDSVDDVEWETLIFFMGLFVMVGALVKVGVIEDVARFATDHVGERFLLAGLILLVMSAVLSGAVDNIPYVAAMTPLVAQLIAAAPDAQGAQSLWWALALGADFGGNATALGASANVVMLGIAKREGAPISFWEFTRYGVIVAAVTVALAVPYVWIRYFLLG